MPPNSSPPHRPRGGREVEAPTALPAHLSKMVTRDAASFRIFDNAFISYAMFEFGGFSPQIDFTDLLRRVQPIFHFIATIHNDAPPGKQFFGTYFHGTEPKVEQEARRKEEIKQFARRFAVYMRVTEEALARTEQQVVIIPNHAEHFRPGWQERLRNAKYLAFVAHYGQYRKSEVDDTDAKSPLPYVWHPFRAEADVLPESFGLLTEETSEATVLHDSMEDVVKGFLMQHYGFSEEEALSYISSFIREHVQPRDKNAVSIFKLLHAVDNRRAVEILGRKPLNRNETIMCRLYHLSRMPEKEFALYYPHVFAISASDRLQNGRTIETHDPKRFAAIWLETSFVYSWLTRYFKMPNCAESFLDLLQNVNADERLKMEASRDKHELVHQLPEKFCDVIYHAIEQEGFSRDELHITFRPRGIRFLDPESQRDRLLASDDSVDHGIAFNNFVHFIPDCHDPSRNAHLVETLNLLIVQLFPREVPGIFDEEKTPFGEHYRYGSDLPGDTVSLQELPSGKQRFGYGVTRVFQDKADYTRSHFGDLHAAVHLQDRNALKKLSRLQRVLQTYVEGPLRTLLFVDAHSEQASLLKRPEGVSRYTKRKVRLAMRCDYVLPDKHKPFAPDQQQLLRRIVYALFYLFFQFHKTQINLVNNAVDSNQFIPSFAPEGMPMATALMFHDPEALLRQPIFADVDSNPLKTTSTVWSREDLDGLVEKLDDFSGTPFGTGLENGVLRYEADRGVPDHRLAAYVYTVCQKMLSLGLEKFVKEGHIQGDVPQRVATIGMET